MNRDVSFLPEIERIAREAGDIFRNAAHIEDSVSAKGSAINLVTEYDKKVQAFLEDELRQLLPGANFLGEENGEDIFKPEYKNGWLFIIDPIDGTSNFIKSYNPSVVSIGLFKDGKPYIGVVYNPRMEELFSAELGCGAFLNGKPIHSSRESLLHSLVVFGTAPYYERSLIQGAFESAFSYMGRCIDVRRSGSVAWDLCSVAAGRAGLYFEPKVQIWDCAAGALILTEAGGKLTDFEGNPLPMNGPSEIVGASEGVAKETYLPVSCLSG